LALQQTFLQAKEEQEKDPSRVPTDSPYSINVLDGCDPFVLFDLDQLPGYQSVKKEQP
jgi:hypothetical protein